MSHVEERPKILFVCTANICRSPLAESNMRRHLTDRGGGALVRSAGFLDAGRPADPSAVEVAAAKGLDLSGHRSLRLTSAIVGGADLVLTMTSDHLRDAVQFKPEALGHIFTLGSFVRLAVATGPRPEAEPFAAWVARIAQRRTPDELFAESDDIADPMGRSQEAFRRTFVLLNRLTFQVASLAFPAGGGFVAKS